MIRARHFSQSLRRRADPSDGKNNDDPEKKSPLSGLSGFQSLSALFEQPPSRRYSRGPREAKPPAVEKPSADTAETQPSTTLTSEEKQSSPGFFASMFSMPGPRKDAQDGDKSNEKVDTGKKSAPSDFAKNSDKVDQKAVSGKEGATIDFAQYSPHPVNKEDSTRKSARLPGLRQPASSRVRREFHPAAESSDSTTTPSGNLGAQDAKEHCERPAKRSVGRRRTVYLRSPGRDSERRPNPFIRRTYKYDPNDVPGLPREFAKEKYLREQKVDVTTTILEEQEHSQSNKQNEPVPTLAYGLDQTSLETETPSKRLTHLTSTGEAHMVDVGDKASTKRIAVARGFVSFSNAQTYPLIYENKNKKGDVLGTARIAGIMAAKRTSDIIPLCHPLAISKVEVAVTLHKGRPRPNSYKGIKNRNGFVYVETLVECTGPTGVEMEALTATSAALLTVYDMCKAADRNMEVGGVHLVYKAGGSSGVYRRRRGWSEMPESCFVPPEDSSPAEDREQGESGVDGAQDTTESSEPAPSVR